MSTDDGGCGVALRGRLFSVDEFQGALGIGRRAFQEMRRQGLPVVKSGKRIWVHGDDAEKFLLERRVSSQSAA